MAVRTRGWWADRAFSRQWAYRRPAGW